MNNGISERLDRRFVAAIQHPLPVLAGEGLRTAHLRQQADAGGGTGLVVPRQQADQLTTQYLWGIGVNYTTTDYAVGVETLVPGNRQTGSHLGVIAQFHLYFDDLFPHSLGKPIVEWF